MDQESAPEAPPTPAPSKGKGMWIGLIVVVIVIVILLAAVFGGLLGPPEDRVLKIGTVLSITGGLAAFGGKNRQGVIMAVDEINAKGGVLGAPIQLFHQNDATNPDTAQAAANTLVSQNRVDAIIGATGSGQCARVITVASANGVFEISGSCTSPRFSNNTLTGGWWARTAPSDALQGVVAASYAHSTNAGNLSYNRAAVIGINNAYGVALANVFAGNFTRLGGTITTNSPRIVTEVGAGATDYTTDLAAVLDVNPAPQVVYLVAYPPDGILMIQNWEAGKATHTAGWRNVFWLFSEGVFDQAGFLDVLRNAPNNFDISAYQGTAPSAFGGITGPNYTSWQNSYRTKWSVSPGLFDDNNYDAAYLIALAAQAAGSATGAAIKSKINAVANPPGTKIYPGQWDKALTELAAGHDIDYDGASGAVNIDNLGDPLSGYIVWAVNGTGGAYNKEVFPEGLVTSLLPAPPMPAPGTRDAFLWELAARVSDA